MGYSTNYYLDVHEGELGISEILDSVGEDFNGLFYAVGLDGDTIDEVKWYSHEVDMIGLSLLFPNIVFELHGEGEDNDDVWNKYFKNGKMQICKAKVTFDKYDESELR